ncbi:unnamed protein product [Staurois parvus]|uniref:Uncharacterized protein n=1 Tax=Staurois parvus TaxID=386267 RepID=A0ABN9CRW0_9NEOB|nr:unnamed protein product [Staurois parvus]
MCKLLFYVKVIAFTNGCIDFFFFFTSNGCDHRLIAGLRRGILTPGATDLV